MVCAWFCLAVFISGFSVCCEVQVYVWRTIRFFCVFCGSHSVFLCCVFVVCSLMFSVLLVIIAVRYAIQNNGKPKQIDKNQNMKFELLELVQE